MQEEGGSRRKWLDVQKRVRPGRGLPVQRWAHCRWETQGSWDRVAWELVSPEQPVGRGEQAGQQRPPGQRALELPAPLGQQ